MCMLIHHPTNADRFTRAEFDDIYKRNRAGFGIIWRWPSGAISYEKGLWEPDRIWSTYSALLEEGVEEMVLHWRFRTSGAVDVANVHPFEMTNRVFVSHNGVLSHRSTVTESDTRCFIADVLEKGRLAREPDVVKMPGFIKWLEDRIGSGNKMILWPRHHTEPTVIGLNRGVAYRGRWYSNTYAWTPPREVWMKEAGDWTQGELPVKRTKTKLVKARTVELRKRGSKMPKPAKGSFQEWLANRWVRV